MRLSRMVDDVGDRNFDFDVKVDVDVDVGVEVIANVDKDFDGLRNYLKVMWL